MKKRYWIAILCAMLALVLTVAAASADAGDEYRIITNVSGLHDGDRIILVSDDGNFNLGEVGPLKTTVRITTRTLNSVTAGTKQMTVKWGASANYTGYQLQYATNKTFTKNLKTIRITNPKTAQRVIKSLTTGTTYYVRIRSYHAFEDMTYYGGWSNVMNCKVK